MVDLRTPIQLCALTSLRFLAAGLVLMYHLPLAIPALASVLRFAQVGFVGVTFFFVLSGFVLAYGWAGGMSVRDFFAKRIARIYPVHVLTALMVLLMILRGGVDWRALAVNLILMQAWSPDPAIYLSFVGAAWSLSCEVFFYACFPVMIALLNRCEHHVRWAVVVVTSAISGGLLLTSHSPGMGEYLYHLPLFRLVDFAVGVLLCLAVRGGWKVAVSPIPATALVVTCYLLILIVRGLGSAGAEWVWLFSLLMVLPFGLLITSVACREIEGRGSILKSRVPVLLGQLSFALYLVHGVVLAAVHEQFRGLQGSAAVLVGVAVVVFTVAASWLLYVLYEHPVESALRRLWIHDDVRTTQAESAHDPQSASTTVGPLRARSIPN